ncbi:MAG TPA: TIR domain-containing protein [Candidatus Lachnoclostridium stercoravium]|uniref:TIR domain-containing protein n=1 Tax=Candidatus Lachnoclostridium stercoravium TaxID=2838633 RepID=A0A9D2HFA3_9FIRM|nr:TIR domain-containing protein [Candidatus Lachnoclostridium stercoravium]
MDKKYDIFISYRRDGGESTAKILRDKLEELGYHVFFDVESLRSGDFNTRLYSVIDECQDFLIVLSPNALDRCVNEDDWVRLEIEHALKKEKNIVPVMLRGFFFPSKLPDSIEPLRYKNGLESNYQFFDAFIEKLQTFLKARPAVGRRVLRKKSGARAVFLIALLAAAGAGAAAIQYMGNLGGGYPATESEKNLTRNLVYYVQQNLLQMETAAEYMDNAYRACETYLQHFDTADSAALEAELQKNRRLLHQIDTDSAAMSRELSEELTDSPFSAADAAAMHDYLVQFCQDNIDNLYYMEFITDRESYIDQTVREDVLENYQAILSEELKLMAYGANGLLLPVENEEELEYFKYDFLPELYYIPFQAGDWKDDEAVLAGMEDSSFNAIQKSLERVTMQVGEQNMDLMKQKAELVNELMESGLSQEEAEQKVNSLMGKTDLVTEQEAELTEAQKELEESLQEARGKFAPAAADDADILWGKMLRFMNLGLYDDAVTCLDMYREKVRGEDEYAEEYTAAAARLIRNISQTGIDYGMIIVGYEPGVSSHSQYKIGDVIISVEGTPCHDYEEYSQIMESIPDGEDFSVTVLRAKEDGSGQLEQITLDIPGDGPRVAMREMTEKTYNTQ